MARSEYIARAEACRATPEAQANRPFTPSLEGPDHLSLARELQIADPSLSLEQALDAAAVELQDLGDVCDRYEDWRVREWTVLMVYAKQWDRDARTGA